MSNVIIAGLVLLAFAAGAIIWQHMSEKHQKRHHKPRAH